MLTNGSTFNRIVISTLTPCPHTRPIPKRKGLKGPTRRLHTPIKGLGRIEELIFGTIDKNIFH